MPLAFKCLHTHTSTLNLSISAYMKKHHPAGVYCLCGAQDSKCLIPADMVHVGGKL